MKFIDSVLVIILVTSFKLNIHCGLLKTTLNVAFKLIDYTEDQLNGFLDFEKKYEKTYANQNEETIAFKNYLKNLLIIDAQNLLFKNKKSKYKTGVWMHSDLDSKSFIRNFTGYKGKPKFRYFKNDFPSNNIPTYKNYTEEGLVTRVMYQGMCGCCWAFATTGALEGQMKKKTGNLVKLSEQNLLDCSKHHEYGNWGCDGGGMTIAYDFIKRQGGINSAAFYRYAARETGKCSYGPRNSVANVMDYVEIERGNETLLMLALAHAGPLAIAIDASQPTFQNYESGIYDDPLCTELPNHAVLLVGYGEDENLGKYWLIKNSWSTAWGEAGYFRLARDKNNLCNVAFDASYPIV